MHEQVFIHLGFIGLDAQLRLQRCQGGLEEAADHVIEQDHLIVMLGVAGEHGQAAGLALVRFEQGALFF